MRKIFAAAILTVFVASRAQAAPVTVSAGDFVTFNFDLSGETPGPPYVLAGFIPNTSGLDFEPPPCGDFCALLDVGEWKLWTELDERDSSSSSGTSAWAVRSSPRCWTECSPPRCRCSKGP
jgi:hypothetical protein